ncbi:putative sarcoplasmic/endoplasmic reticulum calcium ATPase [Auricularia subglabra TFB-10046 SS5]|uniref:P-type Na(+) transporter n=1 Tax=Auricularia subglabra (strain TFB-10046 / SS5) TaxID=717982 RepID=J0WTQ8_AURST|nr:putative sarcoplasmic/endoplasmic reticulum calcium ATPase [Auricularia subglabra TFB-10046 SS5]
MTNEKYTRASATKGGDVPTYSQPPHMLSGDDVVRELDTDGDHGLSEEESRKRFLQYGKNELDGSGGVQAWRVLLKQVANAMTIVLVLAMSLSFGVRDYVEGGVILAVIFINITIGFMQEYRAEQTMESLRNMSAPTAAVLRRGQFHHIPNAEAVPGDIVELVVGDVVPADIRLLETMNLQADEMLLTGESVPVFKDAEDILDAPDVPLGDRTNIAFASSTIVKGRGRGVIIYTGMSTAVGEIAKQIKGGQRKPNRSLSRKTGNLQPIRGMAWRIWDVIGAILGVTVGTPLQKKLSKLAFVLLGIAVLLAIVVFGVNKFRLSHEVVIYAIALGISIIPESLIAVLTITMAVGMKTMVRRKVIVRKLDALEALGGVDSICSDKTGTLTQGKMITRRVWLPTSGFLSVLEYGDASDPTVGQVAWDGGTPPLQSPLPADVDKQPLDVANVSPDLRAFLWAISMCNIAKVLYSESEGKYLVTGEPTEIALQVFAHRFRAGRRQWLNAGWRQHLEFPFDSDCKRMSVVYTEPKTEGLHVFAKGAVERLLDSCTNYGYGTHSRPMTGEDKEEILLKMQELATQGLRVLCVAYRRLDGTIAEWENKEREHFETDLTFVGLAAIYDPPRAETAGAVTECRAAGISVHMLTGDHPATASAIAREVGIIPSKLPKELESTMVKTAQQFDAMTDEEIDALPTLPLVIARCAPQTKVKMINALHRRNKYCAMTGDGVNDSPSLKKADVGIAMGLGGSDVAKSASDIVLTDDNFSSIVAAVEEGRRMFDNIQKFLLHLMIGNVGEVILLVIGLAFRDRDGFSVFPLAPLQVLLINTITGFPAFGLGLEKAQPDIMRRRPSGAMFSWEVIIDLVLYGLFMGALCLVTFVIIVWGSGGGNLGHDCNASYNDSCDAVFRARAACYVQTTWLLLFVAWELKSIRRSIFRLNPATESRFPFFRDMWVNKFLFFSVIVGALSVFPVVFINGLNTNVFKHKRITWEWALPLVGLPLFLFLIEMWKLVKRQLRLFEEPPVDGENLPTP